MRVRTFRKIRNAGAADIVGTIGLVVPLPGPKLRTREPRLTVVAKARTDSWGGPRGAAKVAAPLLCDQRSVRHDGCGAHTANFAKSCGPVSAFVLLWHCMVQHMIQSKNWGRYGAAPRCSGPSFAASKHAPRRGDLGLCAGPAPGPKISVPRAPPYRCCKL